MLYLFAKDKGGKEMFTFYEIEIQVDNEGKESKGMYSYSDENQKVARDKAVAVFHQKMASGMQSKTLKSVLNMVINEHGGTEVKENWQAPEEDEVSAD
jgi:inosine-uridine nucleoside N-ribohydrolase